MRQSTLRTTLSLLAVAFLLPGAAPGLADEESEWLSALKNTVEPTGVRLGIDAEASASNRSSGEEMPDAALLKSMSPTDLRTRASIHLKEGEIDVAIDMVEQAIELQPEDTEGRRIYADALEHKVMAQAERDPHMFNQCVKQWYFLYKNAEYPDNVTLAARHLKDLTGKSPYVWPTAKLYLSRVLLPEAGNGVAAAAVTEEPVQIH
jgi:hypothetical protein